MSKINFLQLYEHIQDQNNYLEFCEKFYGYPFSMYSSSNPKEIGFLLEILNKKSKVLDVGYGLGGFIKLLRNHGYKSVFGYDPNGVEIEGKVEFIGDKKYQDIFLVDVFYFINNCSKFIESLVSSLEGSGKITIVQSFDDSLRSKELIKNLMEHKVKEVYSDSDFFIKSLEKKVKLARVFNLSSFLINSFQKELQDFKSSYEKGYLKRKILILEN